MSTPAIPMEYAQPRSLARIGLLPAVCLLVTVAATLVNPLDLSGSAEEEVKLSGQVVAKLAVAALAMLVAAWGVLALPRVRESLFTLPGMLLLSLGLVLVVTSAVAIPEIATAARIASILFVGYIVFAVTALVVLGIERIAWGCLIGCSLFVLLSWLAYLAVPSLGVFVEDLGNGVKVSRMGGLAHPNVLGRVAMVTVILAVSLFRRSSARRDLQILLLVLAMIGLGTAAVAFSRTAILAGGAALVVLAADWLPTRRGILLGVSAAAIGLASLLAVELATGSDILGRVLLSAGTKTGDVEELTSATGRTDIWAEAWRLIQGRPITGYGLNSGPVLLVHFSQHTHNILLHPLLSAGVLAGVAMLLLLLFNLFACVRDSDPLIRSVAAFVLVSGLFEDTVLETFPGPVTLLWLTVTMAPAILLVAKPRLPGVDQAMVPRYTGDKSFAK